MRAPKVSFLRWHERYIRLYPIPPHLGLFIKHILSPNHQPTLQTKHLNLKQPTNQPTSCLLPPVPCPSPLSMASVVAPPAVFSTTSSHRSAAPTMLPTLLAAQALRSRAHPRACSARCGTGKHFHQPPSPYHTNSYLAPSEVSVPTPRSKSITLLHQQLFISCPAYLRQRE